MKKAIQFQSIEEVSKPKKRRRAAGSAFLTTLQRFEGVQEKLLRLLEDQVRNRDSAMTLEEINAGLKVCRENIVSLKALAPTGDASVMNVITKMPLEEK